MLRNSTLLQLTEYEVKLVVAKAENKYLYRNLLRNIIFLIYYMKYYLFINIMIVKYYKI